ncbi:MAG TPA: 3-phosphoglycerate dehydrogenase [Advenella kashmirensis]|uniref:3-phosphoglycerate dehydrogenase n=1 Tax=Advenella kashmirensis TaxID=310575 RepID=A0A356LBK9_9BURK|nr:3-phosphoglycerate dehydrogenase [Advenella kashmirensis]
MTAARHKILVTGADLASQALQALQDYEVIYTGALPTEAQLIALVKAHDPIGIIVRYGRITRSVIEHARSLKVISKHGSGIDTIDVAAAKDNGIVVRAAAGANAAAVAEHALGLLLACAKSIAQQNARMHDGHWDKARHKSIELRTKTIGLIGLGSIGRKMAVMCRAMQLNVIAYDPFVTRDDNLALVPLEQIWSEADFISLHCPLSEENRNLINAGTLAACRKGVILINTARGGLVDEVALLAAVQSGQVFAAGLDSFAQEPPAKDHAFFGEPQIILSPHVGGVTGQAYIDMGVAAAENLLRGLVDSGIQSQKAQTA